MQERTQKLNLAIEEATSIIATDDMLELPFVDYNQIFAVFGSFILPLIAPMLKNIMVELKQIRHCNNK